MSYNVSTITIANEQQIFKSWLDFFIQWSCYLLAINEIIHDESHIPALKNYTLIIILVVWMFMNFFLPNFKLQHTEFD